MMSLKNLETIRKLECISEIGQFSSYILRLISWHIQCSDRAVTEGY